MKAYQEWISNNVPERCEGSCLDYAQKMQKAFPELKIRGRAGVLGGGHYWCVTKDGTVVDPTVAQFQGVIPGYQRSLPIEAFSDCYKCHWCGGPVWPNTPEIQEHLGLSEEELGEHTECKKELDLEFNTH